MFGLIWATLLFSVISSCTCRVSANQPYQRKYARFTLREAQITAEAGLCVVIPCSFRTSSDFTPGFIVWYKCESSCYYWDTIHFSYENNKKVRGKVSLLEPDVRKRNCSIIINDLNESDSGSYYPRVDGLSNRGTSEYGFSPTTTLSVKALTQKPTVMVPALTEGQQTTLTCSAPGLCSGSVPTITWTWSGAGEKDSHITGNITDFKTENLTAVSQRHSSTLTFNPSAEHHSSNITCKVSFTNRITTEETVTLNVTYVKKPVITGNTTVKKGEALNLTCSLESFPLSVITWTKHGSNKSLTQSNTGTANLVVVNVTEEYLGPYICSAKYQDTIQMAHAEVIITVSPRVLNSSGCVAQLEVLTCVCISDGFPLPTIEWPLLTTHSEYSVTTSVLNHTVNSSVTVKRQNHSSFSCVSSSEVGTVEVNLSVKESEQEVLDLLRIFLLTLNLPQVIIAFLIGIHLSATICCLATTCHRNKRKSSGNMHETAVECLEMISAGQVENNHTLGQEEAGGEAEAAGQSDADCRVEVEYSNIDFSLLKRKNPTEAEDTQESTETEYAEIKNRETEESRDQSGEDGEILEGDEEQREEEEIKQCMSAEEEEGEDMAVYSNVKKIMEEI